MDDIIYQSIVKELSGEASQQEREQVKQWKAEGNNYVIYEAISRHLANPDEASTAGEVFARVSGRIADEEGQFSEIQPPRNVRPLWVKVAAAIVLLLGVTWAIWEQNTNDVQGIVINQRVEKVNPRGQKSSFVLSDGTLVKLNADSKLTFHEKFTDSGRHVYLEGEAFFDVKKDANRPFVVHSGKLTTTALGTSFNVQAYPDEGSVNVALLTGKVLVNTEDGMSKGVVLLPNDMAAFDKQQRSITKQEFDPEKVLAWKNQTLYFKDAQLIDMLKTLERWYGVRFVLADKDHEDWPTIFTGKFKDKSLEYVLDVLSKNQETFSYSINEKTITVSKN